MTIAFLVFVAPFAACVTLTHGYDGSATAIGHYFEGTVPHFCHATMITALLCCSPTPNFGSIALSA